MREIKKPLDDGVTFQRKMGVRTSRLRRKKGRWGNNIALVGNIATMSQLQKGKITGNLKGKGPKECAVGGKGKGE